MRCPCRPAGNGGPGYDAVRGAMYRLMPGWFAMHDELMSPNEPGSSICCVMSEAARNPGKPLDDVIREYFRDGWFRYHADGDEDW